MAETIPLFPLNTVLFPDGPLRLRIFEPRYVDMIGRCMRSGEGFGVAMIIEGREAGVAKTVEVGTTARITDFEQLKDGLLGISARGERRFRILNAQRQSDGLNIADIEWLPAETTMGVPEELTVLSDVLRQILPKLSELYSEAETRYDDASWVAARLAEVLPISLVDRQHCLELTDPEARLRWLLKCMQRDA